MTWTPSLNHEGPRPGSSYRAARRNAQRSKRAQQLATVRHAAGLTRRQAERALADIRTSGGIGFAVDPFADLDTRKGRETAARLLGISALTHELVRVGMVPRVTRAAA